MPVSYGKVVKMVKRAVFEIKKAGDKPQTIQNHPNGDLDGPKTTKKVKWS